MKPFFATLSNNNIQPCKIKDRNGGGGVIPDHHRTSIKAKPKSFRLIAFVAILLISVPLVTLADTCIVIIRTADEIVAAADSMGRRGDGAALATCKIVQADRHIFFAASGLTNNPPTKFTVDALARRAAAVQGTISEKADRLSELLPNPLREGLIEIKRDFPDKYVRDFPDNAVILNAAFFGFENGAPTICERAWLKLSNDKGEPVVKFERARNCPGANCVDDVMFSDLGRDDEVIAWKRQYKNWNLPILDIAHFMVSFEAITYPETVSSPIDILQITRDRARWMQKKENCPEILPYWKP